MKYSKLIALFFVAFLFTFAAYSQDEAKKVPYDQFGAGVLLANDFVNRGATSYGGTLAYALDPDMHIGTQLAFIFDSGEDNSVTYFLIAPYFKYFFTPIKSFRPFAQFCFQVQSIPNRVQDTKTYKWSDGTKTSTSIAISGGAEWFPYKSVGVYAGIQAINLYFSPTRYIIGTGNAFMGIEWFF
jgi:hypothetical protein